MRCCCPHASSASRLFGRLAHRYRRRFERRGLERSQQQLLEGLESAGFLGARILEVGCGVGHFHQIMLERGADCATGVDLAPEMIAEAERWAGERGLSRRTQYLVGDFLTLEPHLNADVTVLDKVICCYPDAEALVRRAVAATSDAIGFTLPHDRWYNHLAAALGAFVFRLLRSSFRPYVHEPPRLEALLSEAGFVCCFEASTPIWLSRVYRRRESVHRIDAP